MPALSAGVQQLDDLASLGINARQIRPAATVAAGATDSEVVEIVAAPMLPGNDVFNPQALDREMNLADPALLASVTGAFPHKIANGGVHQEFA